MGTQPLRYNALAAECTSMLEDRRAVPTKMRIECYSVASIAE